MKAHKIRSQLGYYGCPIRVFFHEDLNKRVYLYESTIILFESILIAAVDLVQDTQTCKLRYNTGFPRRKGYRKSERL